MDKPEFRVERGPAATDEAFAIGMAKLLEREGRTIAAAELRRLHASCEDYAQHKQRQDQRVLALTAQRDALLEACRFYASMMGRRKSDGEPFYMTPLDFDCGDRARAAIKAAEGENT